MSLLRKFLSSRSGNYAMMLSIMALPLIGGIGMAVDYAEALRIRSLLNGAADAAALGAVSRGSPTFKNGGVFDDDWTEEDAKEDALNLFNAYIIGKKGFTIDELSASFSQDGSDIIAKVNFKAHVPMNFMRIVGKDSVPIDGSVVASIRTAPYIDFYMLLDNSPSMGVGATPSDVATMVANTSDKCAFACHDLSNANNYYQLSKKLKVTMRIDVVRQATEQLFVKAEEVRVHSDQFRMGVYTFGEAATALGLKEMIAPTSKMNKAKNAAKKVDLMTIPYQNYDNDQQTSFDNTFAALNDKIADPGSGKDAAHPQKVVFFVSDGVGDSYKPSTCTKKTTGGRCQEPIDLKVCDQLKARGIRIAALYTTYLPLPTNGWYQTWIAPFSNEIGTKMSQCATPGLYFEVSPTEGISEAMEALFMKVINSPRITS
ncbi:MAG: pilus assembly protein TadG-related protein [Mesorhizobium sp.]|nr:pilus assembly protein TadG-related protein [Mesorhizobium sp.]MCO5160064.1 pilus assembly protein TadG-related protein [Mesorhizobium sp.]